uniref:Uncharacterized protein n=1 Tax=Candidatus Kentrum sp. TC TaxID=2126339 RepID=A0A450YWQ6_9GAMM|nr:MAG: hypothetical protein BECKTC1821E_GA0114239_10572 [Candidatus Kentron sp. TC]
MAGSEKNRCPRKEHPVWILARSAEALKARKTVKELPVEFKVHPGQNQHMEETCAERITGKLQSCFGSRSGTSGCRARPLVPADRKAASGVGLVEKKDRTSRPSLEDKRQCIEPEHPKPSIRRQCELIDPARASYYRSTPVRAETQESLELMRLLDEKYTRHPFYGSRKMFYLLRGQGEPQAGAAINAQTPGASAQALPVPAARTVHRAGRSSVVRGYHLYPHAPRVCVSGNGDGLVQSLRARPAWTARAALWTTSWSNAYGAR